MQDQAPIDYTPSHLIERILAQRQNALHHLPPGGERKTVTSLFADIADSTALIHDCDPEEAQALIDPALGLMMEAVHHYEGYVAKTLGDGILALFGAPLACEDHAQRALFAALRMRDNLVRHAARQAGQPARLLRIRVGIHSGEVVVREVRAEDLHAEYDPVGQTIHIASRLEALAEPNSILATDATYRLAQGYFSFESRGAVSVKGVPEPLRVHRLLGPGPWHTRLQVAQSRGLAHFVGREPELRVLEQSLLKSQQGHGQLVAVAGEPGVGKSRLFHEFKHSARTQSLVLETYSLSHGKAFAYLPLIELLKGYFQIGNHDEDWRRREKIADKVLAVAPALEDRLPLLLFLLGIGELGRRLQQMAPALRRQRTLETVVQLLLAECRRQPLVIVFEDLQWLDSESEAFLACLLESIGQAPVLLLVNFRPEYDFRWAESPGVSLLRLDPLGAAESGVLLDALLGLDPVLVALKARVMADTEGNPFFIEEVVQSLIEEGVLSGPAGRRSLQKSLTTLRIPSSVQGLLSARIDRLGPAEKSLLQTVAVIGREAPWSLIQQVSGQPEVKLRRWLSHLEDGEFLYQRPAYPEIEFCFKHALTQEVAYGSLLSAQRRALHESTATAIEALSRENLDEHCNALAHHFSQSGNTDKALHFLRIAGEQAMHRSASMEALAHFGRAVELLGTLPDSLQRDQRELELQCLLGPTWMAVKGYGSAEVERTYNRALALSRRLSDSSKLFPVLVGLRRYYVLQAEYPTALELAQQMLQLAESTRDSDMRLQAHSALGATLFFQGRLRAARSHLQRAIELYEPEVHQEHAFLYGVDPGLLAMVFEVWRLWYQGFPEQALRFSDRVLDVARASKIPFSLADPLVFRAELHQLRHEPADARTWAEAAIELAAEQGFPYWQARGMVIRGWALANQGDEGEGISLMRQGLADYRATGARVLRPYFLGLLAEVLLDNGHLNEARTSLREALELVDGTGEGFYAAELFRLKGKLLIAGEDGGWNLPAQLAFDKSIELARQEGMLIIELRTLRDLVNLDRNGERMWYSLERLGKLIQRIPEGKGNPDIREADRIFRRFKQVNKKAGKGGDY
ncbi:adenylate/guanylate cyclase domain-containing protein [Marinobacterium nitratireducens]|uniref:Adenylate/guanylate cyclase domain-containing protein n=1 Tax=Marinobacterium nitratireducens TaxID=518897 RepID=A0A918DU46_9GAMM|nr:adenylate/guanylate cyclase domain-containing protein [Marinobacterium nitratireducens]GGO83938.1 adenylate/guanylate cyclase domain-containing protein [Marinobacterium nitratireducens]